MTNRERTFAPFRKILVPVIHGCDPAAALAAARLAAGQNRIVLAGLVRVPPDESLSTGAIPAREMRAILRDLADGEQVRYRARVRVSDTPWQELQALIEEEGPDLLVLEWPCGLESLGVTSETVLAHPPCDVALVRGPLTGRPAKVLAPLRGGPSAELVLRLSLAVAHSTQAELTSLHILDPQTIRAARRDAPFVGLARVLASLPEVKQRQIEMGDDPGGAIVKAASGFDLVVMGAAARPGGSAISLGDVTDRVLRESTAPVMVVRTQRPLPPDLATETAGQTAISVLVDKWFAENTYHADEFAALDDLLDLKQRQEVTISLALPALNEEETVGNVIQTLKRALVDEAPLVDEMVLIDSDSTDRTREIAHDLGIPAHIHQRLLPEYGARPGKGEALWKSLYVTRGDILIWIDTDITNIDPHFVYGLLGPMLLSPGIQFIKGFYRRPLRVGDKVQAGGGGRVTELAARPLLNLFYPELSGIVQPLAGEYGGRRTALEQVSFFSGYGVEIGLLIGIFERFGLSAIAQVDLQERIHRNQPLEPLSKMSFAIIQTMIHKLEARYGRAILEDVNKTMKLIRYADDRFFLEVEEIAERERPPMIELPEYRARQGVNSGPGRGG